MLKSHPTAAELYQKVRRHLKKISLGTVYRNLEVLVGNKSIRKLDMSGSETRFDGEIKPHHHARCTKCGAIDDLFYLPQNIVPRRHMNLDDYDVQGYRIEFYGLCSKCKSKKQIIKTTK